MLSGWLGGRFPKRYILSIIYFTRCCGRGFSRHDAGNPAVTLIYGAVTGLMWLSSVRRHRARRHHVGTRWLSMLFGVAFFQPPGRRLSWRLAWRSGLLIAPGPTTLSGGWARPSRRFRADQSPDHREASRANWLRHRREPAVATFSVHAGA